MQQSDSLDSLKTNFERISQIKERANVFVFGKKHELIYANDLQLETSKKLCGRGKLDEVRGYLISDIYVNMPQKANVLCNQNEQILQSESVKFFPSILTIPHHTKISFFTVKFPVYSQNGKLFGVGGIAYYMSELSFTSISSYKLSMREIECLEYLLDGKTAKEIARALNLSSRTIESYLETIKHKMNCQNKLELINKLKNIGFKKRYINNFF